MPMTRADILAELEDGIRSSTVDSPRETALATSERIIARVTDGIYREPWAAFRELVANAYDADATYVVIETGQPEFARMTVRDDGIGMSPKTFAYVLKSIGGSSKRSHAGVDLNTVRNDALDVSPGGRKLIGKIGIGLFAVAQLTQHFQIITKSAGESKRISADVQLRTHDEERMQDPDGEYIAGHVKIMSEQVPDGEEHTHGTSVVLYQLRKQVRETLQSYERWQSTRVVGEDGGSIQNAPEFHIGCPLEETSVEANFPWAYSDTPSEKFDRLIEAIGESSGRGAKSANLEHFDEYLRLIWNLSLSLPLDYIGGHPFDKKGSSGILYLGIPSEKGQAESIEIDSGQSLRDRLNLQEGEGGSPSRNSFSVTLDGIDLKRPIRLPGQLVRRESRVRIKDPVMMVGKQERVFSENVQDRAGGQLSFEAYLYWNSRIVPKETAGVLIRVRGASGTLFDPTFLKYQISEQTRLRQITAEIFVNEGLDTAINIDRESFNYSHPHFLYIQKWLHRALRLLVNRLKALSSADLERAKKEIRDNTLAYAQEVWSRRLGDVESVPLLDMDAVRLPDEIGDADIEWPSENISTAKGKAVSPAKVHALATVLEAYGVLSELPIEDRAQIIMDIIRITEAGA